MSAAKPARRSPLAALCLVALVLLLALGLASDNFRQLFIDALGRVRPQAVIATLPGQAAAMLLCAAALRALRPGVSYWGSVGARLLRDAGDNLLVLLPGLGDVIGARALVLAGGQTRAAVTAIVLDKMAEGVAQIPYAVLAVFVLLHSWQPHGPGWPDRLPSWSTVLAVVAGAVVLVLLVRRLLDTELAARLIRWLRAEWALLAHELRRQRSGLPLATALHFAAWAVGGLQLWMGARALGFEISLFAAVAIESIAYTGRAIMVFIPAGLVVQEASFVAGGLAFGLTAEQSLTLALVLRLRDVVFGLPLLAWPAFEYRHGRRARNHSAQ